MRNSPTSDHQGRTISLLWLFAILNILFRDIHELTTASAITDILAGQVSGRPVTETALLVGGVLVELLLLAFLLSALLPSRWAKRMNLILAPLAMVGVAFGAPSDPDDYFFAAVEIATFLIIIALAWRWRTDASATFAAGTRHAV